MIIGRHKEQQKLKELYECGQAEFAAIYGRRRVRKTFLVDVVLNSRITIRHARLYSVTIKNNETF